MQLLNADSFLYFYSCPSICSYICMQCPRSRQKALILWQRKRCW